MQKIEIENRAKNLLTDYWDRKLPVKLNRMVDAFKIVIKKDMMFDSSGIISSDGNIVSCKINVMDSEEKHRYAIACAIGYIELNSQNLENFSFDVVKDYNELVEDKKDKIWQAVKFAHYLLMPEQFVKREVEEGKKQGIIPSFSYLYYSKEFKVPQEIIKERFKELNIN